MSPKALMLTTLTCVLLTACQRSIDFDNVVDPQSAFTIVLDVDTLDERMHSPRRFTKGTKEWQAINSFLRNNTRGWHTSPVSYQGRYVIKQDDLSVVRMDNGVVVSFVDNDGTIVQVSKQCDAAELDILIE